MELKVLLLIAWVILNLVDYLLTQKILSEGGKELNPVVRTLGLLPVKIVSMVVAGVLGWFLPVYFIAGIDVLLVAVCVWNLIQSKKQ